MAVWKSILALVCFAVMMGAGAAQNRSISPTLDDYLNYNKQPTTKEFNLLYLNGIRDGSSTVVMMEDEPTPFCIPGKLVLTVEQAEDIMLRFAKDHAP